jgi:hypothetical protein
MSTSEEKIVETENDNDESTVSDVDEPGKDEKKIVRGKFRVCFKNDKLCKRNE